MKPPSKICVCVGDISRHDALDILSNEELCELRLDLLKDIEPLDELLNAGTRLVITCRSCDKLTTAERYSIFKKVIEYPVYAIDLDLDDPLLADLKEPILTSGVRLILSYHNYTETPGVEKLSELRESAFKAGANIFKIAALVNVKSDAIRLLSLLEDKREQIVIGMGELGKIVRIGAPYLGSSFTYAATKGKGTAPGQLDSEELKKCWRILGEP